MGTKKPIDCYVEMQTRDADFGLTRVFTLCDEKVCRESRDLLVVQSSLNQSKSSLEKIRV
jgi:hypothetical protein